MKSKLAPDTILFNARVRTAHASTPAQWALAVQGDRIVASGSTSTVCELAGGATRLVDLENRIILPGLIDAHIHLEQYALQLERIDCETPTLEECLARVASRAQATPAGSWILGHGWNQNRWAGFPTRGELDRAAPNHRVYLTAKSLHAGWANSAALQAAGLASETRDPPDGTLQRDSQGDLTGIVFEGATRLIAQAIPATTTEESARALEQAQAVLWSYGLTGAHDFDGPRCLQALQLMRERATLGLRVLKSIPVDRLEEALALGVHSGFGDAWLRLGGVKVFADGALGPRTAAMLEPYEGESDNLGKSFHDRHTLAQLALKTHAAGLSLAIHAIGDRANREVLEAFDALRGAEPPGYGARMPDRVEHVQLLHPSDVSRLSQLGLVASMQPIHATSDRQMAERYWGRRCSTSYAWNSLLSHGTRLVFGSDAPVESPDPFWGIHAAVTRREADGSPGPEGWIPEQRISCRAALEAYTAAPAALAGWPSGAAQLLALGSFADLIVLDEDPFTCPEENLRGIHPAGTMVAGVWRHRAF